MPSKKGKIERLNAVTFILLGSAVLASKFISPEAKQKLKEKSDELAQANAEFAGLRSRVAYSNNILPNQ